MNSLNSSENKMMQASYTRGSRFMPDVEWVESGDKAWSLAFSDIASGKAWPLGIIDENGNEYDRLAIYKVWLASDCGKTVPELIDKQNGNGSVEVETGIQPEDHSFPIKDISQEEILFSRLTIRQRKWVIDKAVSLLPDYLLEVYKKEIRTGKNWEEIITISGTIRQNRDGILNHILKRMKEIGLGEEALGEMI